jgi:transcriptional regulator with XRE-family HTH domain
LRSARKKVGLTQRQVSDAIGYGSPQFVCNWETGKSAPSPMAWGVLKEIYHLADPDIINVMDNYYMKQNSGKLMKLRNHLKEVPGGYTQ